jgi:hypothetical protein
MHQIILVLRILTHYLGIVDFTFKEPPKNSEDSGRLLEICVIASVIIMSLDLYGNGKRSIGDKGNSGMYGIYKNVFDPRNVP